MFVIKTGQMYPYVCGACGKDFLHARQLVDHVKAERTANPPVRERLLSQLKSVSGF